ncbi:lysozyme inhibitor LprI family protein [Paraburkholderia xenovorans]|uniref:lysozyme inhibitor LprI family protein n=1 Tax=Paraburkholderia xenovorans TaxID=36873 RepID=UPI0038BBC818
MAFLLAGFVCASLHAATTNVVDEIVSRSGLNASEVAALLANCDASQTSMNFCAWRDRLVAEQDLQRAISSKTDSFSCKARLEKRVSKWITQRDRACQIGAQRDWGNGSERQAAQTVCVTEATARITGKVKSFRCG